MLFFYKFDAHEFYMNRSRLIIFLGLILLPFITSLAQNTVLDSLKGELSHLEGSDRIPSLLLIAEELNSTDLSSSIKYANEALALASIDGNSNLIGDCQKQLGSNFYKQGKYDKAHISFNKAIISYQKGGNSPQHSDIFINIGMIYSREGLLDSASFYYQKSLDDGCQFHDTLLQIQALRSIGNVYYKQGKFDESLKTFHQALSLASYTNCCIQEQARLFNNLGILFSDWGKYETSLKYYHQALSIMDSLKNHKEVSRIYNNMGTIYWYQDNSDLALMYYLKSLKIRDLTGDLNGKAFVLNNLGMYYGSQEKYTESLKYFKQSLSIFEQHSNRQGVVMALYNIGSVYQELENYSHAKKHFMESLSISKTQGFSDYIEANYEALKDIYSATEDWEKAYQSLYNYNVVKDSIRKEQNIELLSEMEVKFEKEKKQADLQILRNQTEENRINSKQTVTIIIGFLLSLILIVISTYLLIRQIKTRSSEKQSKLTPALLRYQMNPQFINSSLVGIKELIAKNRVIESSKFLAGFAKLIRIFIETSSSNVIVLDKEIETIRSFLKLHQLRYDHQLNFDLEIASHIETEMLAIPPFLFFPIFVHVIDYHLSEGLVDIKIIMDTRENYLVIKADMKYSIHSSDIDEDKRSLDNSMFNVQERIDLLNKTLKDKMNFTHKEAIKFDGHTKTLGLQLSLPIKPM